MDEIKIGFSEGETTVVDLQTGQEVDEPEVAARALTVFIGAAKEANQRVTKVDDQEDATPDNVTSLTEFRRRKQ